MNAHFIALSMFDSVFVKFELDENEKLYLLMRGMASDTGGRRSATTIWNTTMDNKVVIPIEIFSPEPCTKKPSSAIIVSNIVGIMILNK
jgi:hypothetical protein